MRAIREHPLSRTVISALIVSLAAILAACVPTEPSEPFEGIWTGTIGPGGSCGTGNVTLVVTQTGSTLTGTYTINGFSTVFTCGILNGAGALTGTVLSNGVSLTLTSGSCTLPMTGTRANATISGTFNNPCTTAFATAPFAVTRN
jgi:hypothetical protein